MPKVLIREYDNSTTGIPTSNNFAVVVPGYFGYHTGDEKKILIDSDVYELKSRSDFELYVGKLPGIKVEYEPPILEELYTGKDANNYSRYINTISLAEFDRYSDPENKIFVYRAEQITDSSAEGFGKTGNLLSTISYKEKTRRVAVDDDGLPIYQKDADGSDKLDDEGNPIPVYETNENGEEIYYEGAEQTVTVRFVKVNHPSEIIWESNLDGSSSSLTSNYCLIKSTNQGKNEVPETQMGNQIAYELLGLGYTVLFKKISEPGDLNNPNFWKPLKDKSVFNFRYLMTGGYYNATAMNAMCDVAKFRNDTDLDDAETLDKLSGRGDCIALCDIDENIPGYEISASLTMSKNIENIGYAAQMISSSNECSAIFGPKVTYVMPDDENFGSNKTFPASFHYLACAARTFERYNEWYAVAGYTRGISNYAVETTSIKLGEIAINTLAPRKANNYINKAVNLVLHERGNYYLWGNRTGYTIDTGLVFHHFLNIRQLCCSIKKQLYTACRHFTFDPNSDLLWINFVNAIKPTLEAMKADQGIKGYTITKTANDKKALLTARIRIVPIEAVEDFDISISLEDSLTGVVVNASEN